MSDLHGNYIDFLRMLNLIKFDNKDTLYIIGDIFNKFGSGLDIYDYIKNKNNIILIKGNHELYVQWSLKNKLLLYLYKDKLKFLRNQLKEKDKIYEKELYDYLKKLPLYIQIDKYILTHNNLYIPDKYKNLNIENILKKQNDINCLVFKNTKKHTFLDFDIIKGHIPIQEVFETKNEVDIYKEENYIYLDGGAGDKNIFGRLLCLNLDNCKQYSI